MACELTTGFGLGCREGMGSIKRIWLQQWSDFETGIAFDATTGEIETLPEATIYPYYLDKMFSNSFVQTLSTENGVIMYTQTLTFSLSKMETSKRNEFHLMAKNRGLVAFVEDNNGSIWMLGRNRGLEISTLEATSGAASGDFNGYNVTLVGEEPNPAERLEAYTTTPFDNAGFADITIGAAI